MSGLEILLAIELVALAYAIYSSSQWKNWIALMSENDVKYKKVDKWVYGEVKEIKLIGEDNQLEKGMYYFVFWLNHNNQQLSTHVSHKQLFDWFKIDQEEFEKKLMKETDKKFKKITKELLN